MHIFVSNMEAVVYTVYMYSPVLTKIIRLTVNIGCELVKNEFGANTLDGSDSTLACMRISRSTFNQLLFQIISVGLEEH